ncbi:type II toxin-antitoxin system PemK/MazF family toxin [Companilactobacillus metriopterae]|uniref:type II toxin-antitoxin system PemK/MazF family toxin n=1 Tax=Companilactobacillus metriopterae TaxID=1909267 RepID=UPI00100B9058|nr:type II toxin-antitoxin system PemK/MazF family toxin [Companilactobacillus metriopterae]
MRKSIDDLVNKSNERFLSISKNPINKKFEQLPYWLDSVSYRYEKEVNNEEPERYYHYERGSVIQVDFGVNMGAEFSGLHFAVVLDKNDNNKKRTLTVIPLTSKNKNNRIKLGKELFNQTTTIFDEQLSDLTAHIEKNKLLVRQLFESDEEFEDAQKEAKNNSNGFADTSFIDISELDSGDDESKNQLRILIAENINETIQELNDKSKVMKIYNKYNHETFARITDITTISKYRIRKINKYDPSGKIKLSSEIMSSISNELMKYYISK